MYSNNSSESINRIIDSINLRQNALILIFTIHHTKSKELLETILLHCICSFDYVKPAELTSEETQFMGKLISELPNEIASGKTVEENRKDVNDHKEKELDEEEDEDVSLEEINKAYESSMFSVKY